MKKWIDRIFSPSLWRNKKRADRMVTSRVSVSTMRSVRNNTQTSRAVGRVVHKIVKTYRDDLTKLAES